MRPIHAVPAVLLAAAALAGCGGNGGSGTTAGTPPPAGAQGATTESTPATQAQTSTTKQASRSSGGGAAAADAAGARVFASSGCGGCHTLKAARSNGNAGPNLDALKPGFDIVKTQVTNGGGGMPAFGGQLSGAQIAALARFVADRAGG